MIRTLTIVTVAAFFLSVVCLAVAVSIAGPDIVSENVWSWSGPWGHHHWGDGRHGLSLSYDSTDGPQASREEPWTGDKLVMDIPGDVTFTQADGPGKIVISGPKPLIDHLSLDGGGIHLDRLRQGDDFSDYRDSGVRVEVTAPKVTYFALHGSGKLDIRNYAQDRLGIGVFGSSDVEAHGSARRVDLTISGSGDADLSELATDAATVSISGSGSAKVGPKSSAKLDISGSGDVTLTSRPAHIESHVSGSGSVEQDDGAALPPPAEAEKPAKPAKVGKKT